MAAGEKSYMKRRKRIISIIIGIGAVLIVLTGLFVVRQRGSKVLHSSMDILPQKEIVFYRQDASVWADEFLGGSSYTLESSGCLVSCIASAVTMMGEAVETPQSLNAQFSELGVYDSDGNILWGNLNNMEKYGVEVYADVSAKILENNLKEGRYPIVRVRMHGVGSFHYVLIVKAEGGTFYCMDPLADGLQPLSAYGNRVYAVRCVYMM